MYRYYREKLHGNHFWEFKGKARQMTYLHTCSLAQDRMGTPTKSRNQGKSDSHSLSKKLNTDTLMELLISNSSFPPVKI